MYHSGLGGGGFMIVRGSNGSEEFIDFRENSLAAAFADMYNSNSDLSLYGGLASGVPGELHGLEYLRKHYGRLPWAHAMAPAINVARNGFIVAMIVVLTLIWMEGTSKGMWSISWQCAHWIMEKALGDLRPRCDLSLCRGVFTQVLTASLLSL